MHRRTPEGKIMDHSKAALLLQFFFDCLFAFFRQGAVLCGHLMGKALIRCLCRPLRSFLCSLIPKATFRFICYFTAADVKYAVRLGWGGVGGGG